MSRTDLSGRFLGAVSLGPANSLVRELGSRLELHRLLLWNAHLFAGGGVSPLAGFALTHPERAEVGERDLLPGRERAAMASRDAAVQDLGACRGRDEESPGGDPI